MKLDSKQYPFVLEPGFVQMINRILDESDVYDKNGVVINFRVRSHNQQHSNCPPAKVVIEASGKLRQVISYKNGDSSNGDDSDTEQLFDFSNNTYRQFQDCAHDIEISYGVFVLFASCLAAYVESGFLQVEISPL